MKPIEKFAEFTTYSGHGVVFLPNYPMAENAWCQARNWLNENRHSDNYDLDFERLTIKFPNSEIAGQLDFRHVGGGHDIRIVHWSWRFPFIHIHRTKGEYLAVFKFAGQQYRYMLDLDALTPWQAKYMLTRLRSRYGSSVWASTVWAEGGQFDGTQ